MGSAQGVHQFSWVLRGMLGGFIPFTVFTGVVWRLFTGFTGFTGDAGGVLLGFTGHTRGFHWGSRGLQGGVTDSTRILGPCTEQIPPSIPQSQQQHHPPPCLSFPTNPHSPMRHQHGTNYPKPHIFKGYTLETPPSPSSLSATSFWKCCTRALALSRSSSTSARRRPRLPTCTRSSSWDEKMG